MSGHPKRPRDPNQLAKFVIDAAISEEKEKEEAAEITRARKGGKKGGPARSAVLTPSQRSAIARLGAQARWKKNGT